MPPSQCSFPGQAQSTELFVLTQLEPQAERERERLIPSWRKGPGLAFFDITPPIANHRCTATRCLMKAERSPVLISYCMWKYFVVRKLLETYRPPLSGSVWSETRDGPRVGVG